MVKYYVILCGSKAENATYYLLNAGRYMMTDMMVMANAIMPFILMAAIFYFMLWRPQKQEQKKRKEMLDSLKRGDKIITIGGMYGTLTKVGPTKVKIRLAEGIEIDFARTAVSCLQDAGADIQPENLEA